MKSVTLAVLLKLEKSLKNSKINLKLRNNNLVNHFIPGLIRVAKN